MCHFLWLTICNSVFLKHLIILLCARNSVRHWEQNGRLDHLCPQERREQTSEEIDMETNKHHSFIERRTLKNARKWWTGKRRNTTLSLSTLTVEIEGLVVKKIPSKWTNMCKNFFFLFLKKWFYFETVMQKLERDWRGDVMGWIVSPKIHVLRSKSPAPQNVTLFGSRIFTEVTKLNWGH